jgi:diaminohydroxyphosphoribosylaminopyrimidine deaminase/5-amino-6-(5-phosphoribosylamino)uracil reductase
VTVSEDEFYMGEALRLARRGAGRVSPNPMVGAVVVQDGRIISRGHHRRFGGPHAEIEALEPLQGRPLGDATLYVTLEPCCHHGKTPPCTDYILQSGIGRVVAGTLDPHDRVAGKGIRRLEEAGVEVNVGILPDGCRELNRTFFHWAENHVPWVTLKWAQSLDGRIATAVGHSQWITSERSRKRTHRLRADHDAVLVGVNTVLQDDPRLTVRHVRGRNPVRIILDSRLRIPLDAAVLEGDSGCSTWIVSLGREAADKTRALAARGIRVLHCQEGAADGIAVGPMLKMLAEQGITSILVEGGAGVLTSFLREGCAQRLVCFIGPMMLGRGIEAVGDLGIARVDDALRFRSWRIRRSGPDLVIDALF